MTWHFRDNGGTWREIDDPQIRVGGAWKEVAEAWVRVGGAWKQFFTRAAAVANPFLESNIVAFANDVFGPTYSSFAAVRVGNDGDIYTSSGFAYNPVSESTQWLATANKADAGNGDYEIRLTGTGDTPSGPALSTWHDDTVSQTWSLSQSGIGSKSFSGTLTIRIAGDASSEVTSSVSITASAGPL